MVMEEKKTVSLFIDHHTNTRTLIYYIIGLNITTLLN